jgi:hypothetical protein
MGRFTTRIARGLAAAAVVVIPASLMVGAAPASAVTNWTIDRDHIVVGASTTNSFKAFDGEVRSFYDGTSIRANLTGPFVGRGTLKATWIFHDGSTASNSDYTAGVQHNINFTSPANRNVVKFTFTYTPNSGSVDDQTTYVGDSPKSTGSCTRLDNDELSIAPSGYASFTGSVWYGCTSDGNVYAQASGTTHWTGASGTTDRAEFIFWYADDTVEVKSTPTVSSSSPNATVGAESDHTKDVTWVGVRIHRFGGAESNTTLPQHSVKFGEDV